jgi:hypothetical protein
MGLVGPGRSVLQPGPGRGRGGPDRMMRAPGRVLVVAATVRLRLAQAW